MPAEDTSPAATRLGSAHCPALLQPSASHRPLSLANLEGVGVGRGLVPHSRGGTQGSRRDVAMQSQRVHLEKRDCTTCGPLETNRAPSRLRRIHGFLM